MDNVRQEIIEYYHNNSSLFNDIIELWHDDLIGRGQELHDCLGLTAEEYECIVNYEYFAHADNYIDFMDYLNRACTEV